MAPFLTQRTDFSSLFFPRQLGLKKSGYVDVGEYRESGLWRVHPGLLAVTTGTKGQKGCFRDISEYAWSWKPHQRFDQLSAPSCDRGARCSSKCAEDLNDRAKVSEALEKYRVVLEYLQELSVGTSPTSLGDAMYRSKLSSVSVGLIPSNMSPAGSYILSLIAAYDIFLIFLVFNIIIVFKILMRGEDGRERREGKTREEDERVRRERGKIEEDTRGG